MKVVGFTFIRNAIKYDYPIVEAITSILPICDSFVVAVGQSEDKTLELIQAIAPHKIKIVQTTWNDSLREGGQVLAVETNKALQAVEPDADWCFYIQGDEVVHEQYLPAIRQAMEAHQNNQKVDGLLFNYLHFYGSYDYVGASNRWYRREIRIVKNDKSIYSYRDDQGFRKGENEKLRVKLIDAYVYHYGWVKKPDAMQRKAESFHKFWHNDQWLEENIAKAQEFDYSQVDALSRFEGSHPKVMQSRIDNANWQFDFDLSRNTFSTKEKFKRFIESLTGHRPFEYKNYKLV